MKIHLLVIAMSLFLVLVIAMSLFLAACTNAGVYAVNSSSRLLGSYELKKDIPFGSHGQSLDIYTPKDMQDSAPVVVFFYGGGWNEGSKDMFTFMGDALTSRGYVVVIADYRKYPQVKFPAFIEDGAQAVAWTVQNIKAYGGEARNVHLMGHSAGAHLGAMLASDERFLRAENVMPERIRSFIGLAGPYHFIPKKQRYKDIFGPPENYPKMHVDNFIEGNEPPMLLLAGGDDDTVNITNLKALEKALYNHKVKVQHRVYDGLGHVGMITPFTRVLRGTAPVLDDVDAFIKANSQ